MIIHIASSLHMNSLLSLFIAMLAIAMSKPNRPSFLPTCNKIEDAFKSKGDGSRDMQAIRDLVQVEGQISRRVFFWRQVVENENRPIEHRFNNLVQSDMKSAFKRSSLESAQQKLNLAKAKVDSAIDKAMESTPALSPFDHAKIRACVYGRSNPHLYEGRPKVSMMLQFFKRPWAIQTHIDKVMECQVRSSSQSASEAS